MKNSGIHGCRWTTPSAGYSTIIRSLSQGRAQYTMQFDHYEEMPKNISDEIVKKYNSN